MRSARQETGKQPHATGGHTSMLEADGRRGSYTNALRKVLDTKVNGTSHGTWSGGNSERLENKEKYGWGARIRT